MSFIYRNEQTEDRQGAGRIRCVEGRVADRDRQSRQVDREPGEESWTDEQRVAGRQVRRRRGRWKNKGFNLKLFILEKKHPLRKILVL